MPFWRFVRVTSNFQRWFKKEVYKPCVHKGAEPWFGLLWHSLMWWVLNLLEIASLSSPHEEQLSRPLVGFPIPCSQRTSPLWKKNWEGSVLSSALHSTWSTLVHSQQSFLPFAIFSLEVHNSWDLQIIWGALNVVSFLFMLPKIFPDIY